MLFIFKQRGFGISMRVSKRSIDQKIFNRIFFNQRECIMEHYAALHGQSLFLLVYISELLPDMSKLLISLFFVFLFLSVNFSSGEGEPSGKLGRIMTKRKFMHSGNWNVSFMWHEHGVKCKAMRGFGLRPPAMGYGETIINSYQVLNIKFGFICPQIGRDFLARVDAFISY